VTLLRESYHTVGDAAGRTVVYFGRYRGSFHEPFDLARFPWDRHYLCVRLSTTWPRWTVEVRGLAGGLTDGGGREGAGTGSQSGYSLGPGQP
jgi:hypothetical protein